MPNPLAIPHLLIRLGPLNRALRAAVERQAAVAAQLDRPDLVPYCITDEQVVALLDRLDALKLSDNVCMTSLTPPEKVAEQQIRDEAAAVGVRLPLDELADRFGLTYDEQQVLLLCAAPELDRAYERVIAYILDDLNRRFSCVELVTAVTAGSGIGGLTHRSVVSRAGRLRLLGLLIPHAETTTELRQEVRVPSGLIEFLLGGGGDPAVLAHDAGAVPIPATIAIPPQLDAAYLDRLGKALQVGNLDLVGVWAPARVGQHEVVQALARAAGMPMRQVVGDDIESALNTAAALGAILWLRTDDLNESSAAARLLTRSRTPVCLSGAVPWRPPAVLAARAYAECAISLPSFRDRSVMWARVLPELDAQTANDLAARYQLSDEQLRAVAALARTGSFDGADGADMHPGTGDGQALNDCVTRAIAAVTSGPVTGFAHAIVPRRRPEDLVLPPNEYQMVLELAAACRAWPRIAEDWGFAAGSGGGGVKALFTGEPGTGKTLTAEVIAGMLGLTLLKIELSQVVSKWVGETEKNLDAAFRQAEHSQALLFFDEADALFGKRGEIKHGIDRYANLEVGFMLQRLEQSNAIIILASNLHHHIDPAFTRRFHHVIHFPRPGREERERIWRLAFPPDAPLAPDVNLSAMAQLDMTGASISGAARTAALLAAGESGQVIGTFHVVQGIRRQYERDARLLRPADLGEYACLIAGDAGGQ